MSDPLFWLDLETRFRTAFDPVDDRLEGHWSGPASQPDEPPPKSRVSYDAYGWTIAKDDCFSARNSIGEEWRLSWLKTRNEERRTLFSWLAERAAVGLGHPGGPTALFF